MSSSRWWTIGVCASAAVGLGLMSGAGCGSSGSGGSGGSSTTTGSGGGSTGTATTSTATSTGTGTGGGSSTSTGTGTATSTGSGTSTSSGSSTGAGGSGPYADCQACTDDAKGAPANECKKAHDDCNANKNCVQIYNCVYDAATGCTTDAAGACCTFACYDSLMGVDAAAKQAAIDLYHAYDSCLYCTTCKTLCDAQEYCAAYDAGPAACMP